MDVADAPRFFALDSGLDRAVEEINGLASAKGLGFQDVALPESVDRYVAALPIHECFELNVIPLHGPNTTLLLATSAPDELAEVTRIDSRIARSIVPCLASRDAIHRSLSMQVFSNTQSWRSHINSGRYDRRLFRTSYAAARTETDRYWRTLGNAATRDYSEYPASLLSRQKRILAEQTGCKL